MKIKLINTMKTLTFYFMYSEIVTIVATKHHKKCDFSFIELLSQNLIYSVIYRTEHVEEACGANKALDA